MNFKDLIKEKRNNLSDGTLKTYNSLLKSLWNKVYGDDEYSDKKINDVEKIKKEIDNMNISTRKTVLSALYVLTGNEEYRKLMMEDISHVQNTNKKQEMNDKQKDAYISQTDLHNKLLDMQSDVKYWYKTNNYSKLQEYIILCLYSGYYIQPRRSQDYVLFKIKNIDKDVDNYFDKNKFIFNTYKTSNKKGQQIIDIPKPLITIIKKWIKHNPTDYLLFDNNENQMTNVKLTQKMERMFNKKVGVNTFRHSYMSDKYKDLIDINKKMEDDFDKMGSSSLQQHVYIQKIKN